jgi:uncharacterized protein (DUF2249 family)/quercetin dioxygenase-like cupin family protein
MELPPTSSGSAANADMVDVDATYDLDVREVPKPQRHPLIFARFDALAVGESFVLVNSHDPKHLRQEFDRDHPGTYDWQYLNSGRANAVGPAGSGRGVCRVRITRLIDGDLPRLVGDIHALTNADAAGASDSAGAVWKLDVARRQLDANVIQLRPGGRIEAHTGPELDVLVHVLGGSGQLSTAEATVELVDGALVWLPRRSRRAITAGADGSCYLSVHSRRPALSIGPVRG